MKWQSPDPKYTNNIWSLNSHDMWKRDRSKERFLAREDAEPIKKVECWVGIWEGFKFITTTKLPLVGYDVVSKSPEWIYWPHDTPKPKHLRDKEE